MIYSVCAEASTWQAQTRLLDELDRVVTKHWSSVKLDLLNLFINWAGWFTQRVGSLATVDKAQDSFLAIAVEFGLVWYIRNKLDQDLCLVNKPGRPLLDYAVFPG